MALVAAIKTPTTSGLATRTRATRVLVASAHREEEEVVTATGRGTKALTDSALEDEEVETATAQATKALTASDPAIKAPTASALEE